MKSKMKEYIERDAVERDVSYLAPGSDYKGRVIDTIRFYPAADVAPVVHGEWIEHGNWWGHIEYNCSACNGQTFDASEFDFCPHCGAKMDGGKK